MKDKKIRKSYRLSDLTVRRLEAIAKKENKDFTEALEFMIQEKADFYGIKILRRKEIPSGAFPYGAGESIRFENNKPEEPKRFIKRILPDAT